MASVQATVLKKTQSISRLIYDVSLIRFSDEIMLAISFVERVHLLNSTIYKELSDFLEVGDKYGSLVVSLFLLHPVQIIHVFLVEVSRIGNERKKSGRYRKDRFCTINYCDQLERESESIRLRSTRERNEGKKWMYSPCATAPWSSDKFVVSFCRGQYRLRLEFTKFGGSTRCCIVADTVMHCADKLTMDMR